MIPNFNMPCLPYCNPIIPTTFDNSLSYYEMLCKLLTIINDMGGKLNEIINIINGQGIDLKIEKIFEQYVNSPEFENLMYTNNGAYTSKLKGEKILIIGDESCLSTNDVPSWIDQLISWYQIPDDTFIIQASGGAGFSVNASITFEQILNQWLSTYTGDLTKISKIIFCGGYHDRQATFTEIKQPAMLLQGIIRPKMPNAQCYIFSTGMSTNLNDRVRLDRLYAAYNECISLQYIFCPMHNFLHSTAAITSTNLITLLGQWQLACGASYILNSKSPMLTINAGLQDDEILKTDGRTYQYDMDIHKLGEVRTYSTLDYMYATYATNVSKTFLFPIDQNEDTYPSQPPVMAIDDDNKLYYGYIINLEGSIQCVFPKIDPVPTTLTVLPQNISRYTCV